jgi:ribonuclease-3
MKNNEYDYFREGISPTAGLHYPMNDLNSLRTIKLCDEITNRIYTLISSKHRPVSIHVINPLYGEQVMSFLSTDWCKEINIYYPTSSYLNANIEIANKHNVQVNMFDEFNGVPSHQANTVLFIDTLWSTTEVNHEFISQSLKVNNKTIEYWIEVAKNCLFAVVNLPPTYGLKEIAGYSYDNIICLTERGCPMLKTCYCIPLSQINWRDELKEYIREMLTNVGIKHAERYVSMKHMKIWSNAFTHKSVSRKNNYEEYETIGDALLKSHFTLYLFERYPSISAHYMTGLRNYYLTKHYMPTIARKYNMLRHIRSVKPVNQDMLEDVLESFFGALYLVANEVSSCSFMVNKQMANYIFDKIEIDLTRGEGDPKSIVRLRTFQRLHLENPEEIVEKDGKLQAVTLKISNTSYDFFKSNGFNIPKTLGEGYGYTKSIASDMAYSNALDCLRKQNVNEKFIQITTEQMRFGTVDLYTEVLKKYQQQGFVGIKVKPEISSQGRMVPLLATDDYYTWDYILATYMVTGECDDAEVYKHLFEMYLRSDDTYEEPDNLDFKSRSELYRIARSRGLSTRKSMTKNELYNLLL